MMARKQRRVAPASSGDEIFLVALSGLADRFPEGEPEDTPVHVEFEADKHGETWTRTFGTHSFCQPPVRGRGSVAAADVRALRPAAHLRWRWLSGEGAADARPAPLGPVWAYRCRCGSARARHPSRQWKTAASASMSRLSHPLTGMIVRYRGWLEPYGKPASSEAASAIAMVG